MANDPETAGPLSLRASLYEMARLMEVMSETSVAAMEYRVRRLVDQDREFRQRTADAHDRFYTDSRKLQDLIVGTISEGSPVRAEMLNLVLGMMFARNDVAARTACEIAVLQEHKRHLQALDLWARVPTQRIDFSAGSGRWHAVVSRPAVFSQYEPDARMRVESVESADDLGELGALLLANGHVRLETPVNAG